MFMATCPLLKFKVQSLPENTSNKKSNWYPSGIRFNYASTNSIRKSHVSVSFPANSFYRSFDFEMDSAKGDSTLYSTIFELHNPFTPVHKSFTLKIKPNSYPPELKDQLYIGYLASNGGDWYIGRKWEGDWMVAKSRILGNYAVMADTVPPEITPLNIFEGKNITKQKSIRVKIRDRKTGIRSYRGEVNGQWLLFEYEPKKSRLEYIIDEKFPKGENYLDVIVTDLVGNESRFRMKLVR